MSQSTGAPWGPEATAFALSVALAGSAFFSGCETGLMSVSRVRLARLAAAGDERVDRLRRVREHLDDAILTCLVGNNLCNVLASAVATALFTAWLGARGEWLAILVTSVVLVVVGEIVPKILTREYPERLTLAAIPTFDNVRWVISPVRWPLGAYARGLRKLQGGTRDTAAALDLGTLASLLSAAAPAERDRRFQQTMSRFLELSGRRLGDLMRPLDTVVSVSSEVTLATALAAATRSGYSRLPVRGTGGDLDGYLLVRDLLLAEGKLAADRPVPASLVRPLILVDSTMSPFELFEELHARGAQFAAVVDRAGRPLGIVTLEDLIEAVTGAIADEFDQPEEITA
ncbi:MAG TPA: CNNM domain-containing protein [Candidatus Krumholzibacteria bacterium]|nr:CNNM domain-containing protein [Candidatus Krumholzibacteria bacterium]HPD71079.1 CNNM domain-containing protein [Candidatus Krumholzibacteria bacterium]HRY39221.1 CNNM domain-containing protein [Candidatus Krumholzibacteria bacterium]